MRFGLAFLAVISAAVSAWFFYAGFSIETVVQTADAPSGVANLQAMHFQMADIVTGGTAAIVAVVCLAASAVVGAVEGGGRNFNE